MALSVLPGSRFTISDHLVPISATPCSMIWSSSAVHSPFFTWGAIVFAGEGERQIYRLDAAIGVEVATSIPTA